MLKINTNNIKQDLINKRKELLVNINNFVKFKKENINYLYFLNYDYFLLDIYYHCYPKYLKLNNDNSIKTSFVCNSSIFLIKMYLYYMNRNGEIPNLSEKYKKDADNIERYYNIIHQYIHKLL